MIPAKRLRGFTLVEVMVAAATIALVMTAAVLVLRAVLLTWSSQKVRAGVAVASDRALALAANELRDATAISDNGHAHELRFAVKRRDGSGVPVMNPVTGKPEQDYYVYYFYNSAGTYQLRRSPLSNVVNGNLATGTYAAGAGQFVAGAVLAPPVSDLSVAGSVATIDVSVRDANETVRKRTDIYPRNY